ncbi:MAG: hypothetical protein Q7R81_02315 [Candidatus Peregrinibacteria bacterium]|nr:hypothetical protein [Candidatus Peregrinibacteria bacterium]
MSESYDGETNGISAGSADGVDSFPSQETPSPDGKTKPSAHARNGTKHTLKSGQRNIAAGFQQLLTATPHFEKTHPSFEGEVERDHAERPFGGNRISPELSRFERWYVGQFAPEDSQTMADALNHGPLVLSDLEPKQFNVREGADDDATRIRLLREFHARGQLKFPPTIDFDVGRSLAQSSERLGWDIRGFLEAFNPAILGTPREKEIILELGPGSGKTKLELKEITRDGYMYLADSDALYIPPKESVGGFINRRRVEKAIGMELTEQEWSTLDEFFTKILLLDEAYLLAPDGPAVRYDERARTRMHRDPNAIGQLMLEKAHLLSTVQTVPSSTSTRGRNGTPLHPYHVQPLQTEGFMRARKLLAENFAEYLLHHDIFETMSVDPRGTIIADFRRLGQLREHGINGLVFGVRSTVFLPKRERFALATDLIQSRMTPESVYANDEVRDLDGGEYCLRELLEMQRQLGLQRPIHVITGPGFEGQDFNQGSTGVVRSYVVGPPPKVEAIGNRLMPVEINGRTGAAYRMRPLTDLTKDVPFLRSQDADGRLANAVAESRQRLGFE